MYRPRMPNNGNQWRPQQHWRPNFPRGRGQVNRGFNPPGNRHQSFPINEKSNDDHWCETCDKGFKTIELLNNHKQQHQKCNIDGCQFIAHPNVITKHIQMQHSSGLYKKIANLNNPEDIKKWREERKKRFPTKSNIDKKAAELKEKIERGEKMGLKPSYFANRNNNLNGPSSKRKYSDNKQNRQPHKRPFKNMDKGDTKPPDKPTNQKRIRKPLPEIPVMEDKRKLKPFAGIQDLELPSDDEENVDYIEDFNIDDDEIVDPQHVVIQERNAAEPTICGALSCLIANYDSSDEDLDKALQIKEPIQEQTKDTGINKCDQSPISKTEMNKDNIGNPVNVIENSIENKSDDDSGPEETKIVKESTDVIATNSATQNIQTETKVKEKTLKERNNKKYQRPFKYKVPSTLLQKLLSNEIQEERNLVLQCVRYIVKNNYFDK